LFRRNLTGKWRHLKEAMAGIYNGATGVVTALNPDGGTLTVRLRADPEAERAWSEAWAKQEREIVELTGQIEALGEKLSTATDKDEKKALERQLYTVTRRARRRRENRGRGLVETGGRLVPRPGNEVVVDAAYLKAGHVSYAYSRTVHASQGSTADVVLIDSQDLKGREAAYVALSRHRSDVRLYHVQTPEAPDTERHVETPGTVEPFSDLLERISHREATPTASEQATAGVWAQVGEILLLASETPTEELAQQADQLATTIRTESESRLSAAKQVAEQRVAEAQFELEAAQASGDRGRVWLAKLRVRDEQGRLARLLARAAAGEDDEERRRLASLRAAQRRQERGQ